MNDSRKRRPRGDARRRAMLDAAAEVFAEKGFERTSLSDIIARSGGSRATLYEAFGSKEGLFEAMIGEACQRVVSPLEASAIRGREPEDVLNSFGLHLAEAITTVESRAVLKILAADGHRLPKVVDFFFRHGMDAVRRGVADYLAEATRAGQLEVANPDAAAAIYMSMVEGEGMVRRIFSALEQPSQEQIRARIRMATGIFLNGVRRRTS